MKTKQEVLKEVLDESGIKDEERDWEAVTVIEAPQIFSRVKCDCSKEISEATDKILDEIENKIDQFKECKLHQFDGKFGPCYECDIREEAIADIKEFIRRVK